MFVLASYPRSGNTFFRNVLYFVYGIESTPYHQRRDRELIEDYEKYPVVKTHMLPEKLPLHLQEVPSVYIVRDARDSLISIAHRRQNFKRKEATFFVYLFEAIVAQGGSFFGGWSENVKQWSQHSSVIIRFEDLIQQPIKEVEKIRSVFDLPSPQIEKLPTFEFLKNGKGKYPEEKEETQIEKKIAAQQFFRKGKIGSWQNEFPALLYILFINYHGDTLEKMGYDLFPKGYRKYKIFKNEFSKKIVLWWVRTLITL